MGGVVDSLGGFLGLSDGPQAPKGNFNNEGIDDLTKFTRSGAFQGLSDPNAQNALVQSQVQGNPLLMQGMNNLQSQIGRNQGLQDSQTGILNGLQNQGFQLTPQDQTMYGQASGDIARLFGNQGNQAANNLASRGLSNSGAAGAMFSGLQGNQNEQLAKAQQGIMQQRFQNTMNQIGQQQNFLSQLGGQNGQMSAQQGQLGQSAMSGQAARNHQNLADYVGTLGQYGGMQEQNNQDRAAAAMGEFNANQANKPKNFMDFATAGIGQGIQSGLSGQQGSSGTFNGKDYKTSGSGAAGLF